MLFGAICAALAFIANAAPENSQEGTCLNCGGPPQPIYPVVEPPLIRASTIPTIVTPVIPPLVPGARPVLVPDQTLPHVAVCGRDFPCDLPNAQRPAVTEPPMYAGDEGQHSLGSPIVGFTYDSGYIADEINVLPYPDERFAGYQSIGQARDFPSASWGKDHGLLYQDTGVVSDLEAAEPSVKITENKKTEVMDLNGRMVPNQPRWLGALPDEFASASRIVFLDSPPVIRPRCGGDEFIAETAFARASTSKSTSEEQFRFGTIIERIPDRPIVLPRPAPPQHVCGPYCGGRCDALPRAPAAEIIETTTIATDARPIAPAPAAWIERPAALWDVERPIAAASWTGYPNYYRYPWVASGPTTVVDTDVDVITPRGSVDIDTDVVTGPAGTAVATDVEIERRPYNRYPSYYPLGETSTTVDTTTTVLSEPPRESDTVVCWRKDGAVLCSDDATFPNDGPVVVRSPGRTVIPIWPNVGGGPRLVDPSRISVVN